MVDSWTLNDDGILNSACIHESTRNSELLLMRSLMRLQHDGILHILVADKAEPALKVSGSKDQRCTMTLV